MLSNATARGTECKPTISSGRPTATSTPPATIIGHRFMSCCPHVIPHVIYSDAYYSEDEFDELYGGEEYRTVKKTYDPDSRFLDLYAKAVQRR